ncbi:MAG: UDP-N-acetylmuramoyl-tripeptide--D-alanyl-D-alanine ligase [Cyclobacteriaceae bacterium]
MMETTEALYSKFLQSTGVSTDSRTVKEGNIFFALSGPSFNGNAYAKSAIEKGALVAVVDDHDYLGNGCVLVENALKALQKLAGHHRDHFKKPVLAITGSNGKTTTKELVREVLAQKFIVQATEGNLNNHIGVPLTILKWTEETEMAIVEMGANHQKEIASYCEYTRPTHGLITNIGHAHTEGFGGIEGVLRGKSELFDFIRKSDGIPFINQEDERLSHMTKRFSKAESFPSDDVEILPGDQFLTLRVGGREARTKLTGSYNFANAAAAVQVGRHFGVSDEKIVSALENYQPQNQRSQIIERNGYTIIMDAYNANPDSMRAALKNLSTFEGRKVAILGDMNELSNSDEEHRSLGKEVMQMNFDEVILVGEKIKPALEFVPSARHFGSTSELVASGFKPQASSTVLLKASRSIKLEELLNSL